MFKKIQDNLLVQYPLLWQSKFIPMLITSLIAWLVAYAWGYASVNLEVLKEENIRYLYDQNFLGIHAIAGIIIYVIWALYFYRTNPFNHLYPLRKFYLPILYFQLVIPLFLILSLYFPFNKGMYDRTKKVLSKEELIEESKAINLAYPFLVVKMEDYKISGRNYPEPFPLNSFQKNDNDTGWVDAGVYFQPKIVDGIFSADNRYYYPEKNAPFTMINGNRMLFYKSHVFTDDRDTCEIKSYDIIDSFYQLDPSLGLYYYGVQNMAQAYLSYSDATIDANSIPTKNYSNYDNQDYYRVNIAPVIYPWMHDHNREDIIQCIERFKSICMKYRIKNHIPTAILVDSLISSNFKLHRNLTYDGFRTYPPDESERTLAEVDFNAIEKLYDNYDTAISSYYYREMPLVFLGFALAIGAIFLLVFCVDLISFLISIPVTGVILILTGLIAMGIERDGLLLAIMLLFISLIILGLGIYAVWSKTINKRVATILFCTAYYATAFVTTFFLLVVYELSKYSYYECGHEVHRYSYEIQPWHGIALALLGYLLSFPLLKKLKAKAF